MVQHDTIITPFATNKKPSELSETLKFLNFCLPDPDSGNVLLVYVSKNIKMQEHVCGFQKVAQEYVFKGFCR